MPTVISIDPIRPPKFRVKFAPSFAGTIITLGGGSKISESGAEWAILNEPDIVKGGNFAGVELLEIERTSLPQVGKASFRYVYGKTALSTIAPPTTMIGYEVLLQLQDFEDNWHTVFWGTVDYEEDRMLPGRENTPTGEKIFYCIDGFARTMKWPMNRHSFDPLDSAPSVFGDTYGHPGYNYYLAADGPLLGNKSGYSYTDPEGVDIRAHIWQGAFSTNGDVNNPYLWTEYEAVNNACASTRAIGEPLFSLREGFANYNNKSPIPVNIDESVFSVVSRICNRSRGLGTVAVKWADQPNGQIRVWLGVTPLNDTSIAFTYINGDGGQVDGASGFTDFGTGRSLSYKNSETDPLDLTGDHRNLDNLFFLGTQEGQLYDYVETHGEHIEMAFTASLEDCTDGMAGIYTEASQFAWAPRWNTAERDIFEGLDVSQRVMDRYRHIYQAFGLPRKWRGEAKDGKGANPHRIDVRCKDDGTLWQPELLSLSDTSPNSCEFLSYLPFYDAFKYDVTYPPKRLDNSPSNGMPNRRPCQVYLRVTEGALDRWFLPDGALPSTVVDKFQWPDQYGNFCPTLSIGPDYVFADSQYFRQYGQRLFADVARDATLPDDRKLNAQRDVTKLAFTVAIKLPYRLSFVSAPGVADLNARLSLYPAGYFKDWKKAKRKRSIYVPNAHLWCASGSTIWDLQQTLNADAEEGMLALRAPMGATATGIAVIRDDRMRVQFFHQIASYWYLNLRKRLRFGQAYCGLIPFQKDVGGTPTTDYPVQINDHIELAQINGAEQTISTNCTSVKYNHQTQTTVWETDYFDLEFRL